MSESFSFESQPASPRLVHIGDPIIRSISRPIQSIMQAAKICRVLTEKLWEIQGAGLAAPQIGVPYRIFVFEVRKTELFPDREESPLYTMINPELEILDESTVVNYEGCFSVPGYLGLVPRARALRVKWTDPDESLREEVFEDYRARVIQHEMDHLNGVVYIDRMPDMSTFTTRENYLKAQC
ncbi:MAG: peptide deformylase [Candidatus Obscuribacterales bacterium]|jgi:peptide deformylase|nr:peptide deformylase [Candidatus Obscuribacterales bacterium]